MERLLDDVPEPGRPNDAHAQRDRESVRRRQRLSSVDRNGQLRQPDRALRRRRLVGVGRVLAVVRAGQSDSHAAGDAKRRMRRQRLSDAEREPGVQQRLLRDELRAVGVVDLGHVLVGLLGLAVAHALDADARVRRRRAVRRAHRDARLRLVGDELRRWLVGRVGRVLGALQRRFAHAHASDHGQPGVRRRRVSAAVGERRLQRAVLRHELRAVGVVGLGRVLRRLLARDAVALAFDHGQRVRQRHTVRREQRESELRRAADRLRHVAVVDVGRVLAVVRRRLATAHAQHHDQSQLWRFGVWHSLRKSSEHIVAFKCCKIFAYLVIWFELNF